MAALMANRQQQTKEARERLALSMKMTQCVTRVSAALPPDAPAETRQKALEADPEWKALDAQIRQAEAAAKETLKQAEALVRKRMQDELRDNQAIQEGKAKAIETPRPALPQEK
jgi:hypothetical protein